MIPICIQVCIIIFSHLIYGIRSDTIIVSTSAQLLNAMNRVRPGDVIFLNNGTYRGSFRAERNGAQNALIVIEGNSNSIISNREGYGIHLRRVNYWHLKGFMIKDSRKGIVLEKSTNNLIESVSIENIEEEGIYIHDDSTDNVVRDSLILMTGTKSLTHGEAILIGTDYYKWVQRKPDQSDRNVIINNRIGPGFTNEAIVISEGTCCGLIANNQFDGNAMSGKNGYGCWVKIKGDRYRIEHNKGTASVSEGFMVSAEWRIYSYSIFL